MDPEEKPKMLGQIIKEARNQKDWTQTDLAQKVSLSVGYISNIEKGYVNPKRGPVVPSDVTLSSFADALDIPVSRLHSALGRGADQSGSDEHEVLDYLRGKPEPIQDKAMKILKAAFGEDDAEDNAGNIGKRTEPVQPPEPKSKRSLRVY